MAQVNTIDVTTSEGSSTFPVNANDIYSLVETLAVQNIRSVKNSSTIEDGVYDYEIENGKVVEESLIEMAEEQAYDKVPKIVVKDPTLHVLYFNNYESKQFQTTIRRDDIRAILARPGAERVGGVEGVVGEILDTLTQGEGNYNFINTRNAIYSAAFKDYSKTALSDEVPLNIKGVIYCMREMYNHLKSTNSDLTTASFKSSTPAEDIRIAISTKLMNLIDVVELANIFNLSKEEIFGKLVIIDVDDLTDHSKDYIVYVYDRKAIGRATRLYDYTQDIYGNARCSTHYLTIERAYFHNGLFKGCKLDCSKAAAAAKAELLGVAG